MADAGSFFVASLIDKDARSSKNYHEVATMVSRIKIFDLGLDNGRMGGRIDQAMDLLPGFHHMLSTLQLHPPQAASSSGSAMGSWEVAYSKVSTAIVANIWK